MRKLHGPCCYRCSPSSSALRQAKRRRLTAFLGDQPEPLADLAGGLVEGICSFFDLKECISMLESLKIQQKDAKIHLNRGHELLPSGFRPAPSPR